MGGIFERVYDSVVRYVRQNIIRSMKVQVGLAAADILEHVTILGSESIR
jgi:hypothetical protein